MSKKTESSPCIRGGRFSRLIQQAETIQVFLRPVCVSDHGAQRTDRKGFSKRVVGDNNTPAVILSVNSMASTNAHQSESICFQGANKLAGANPAGNPRHTFTATAGSGSSIVPCSIGILSPASTRSCT